MWSQWIFLFVQCAFAVLPPDGKSFWWTALGDSYASGVGADNYIGGQRCLRYDQAYPQRLQKYTDLGGANIATRAFQNCVCSGAHVDDVADYQLLDEDTTHKPSDQYGDRPKFGQPTMATLTIGGDDVDFPGILFNCILDAHVPGGPPSRTCDDQKAHSWNLIKSPDLVKSISGLIQKIVDKGRAGPVGDKFRLYVTGYGQFFNEKTHLCDKVTFARTANPKPDGKKHLLLTTDVRHEFNQMALALNKAIQSAVDQHAKTNVKYIDIDGILDKGHRFCEENVNEPDQHNPNLWFFHYPYNEPDDVAVQGGYDFSSVIKAANDKVYGTLSTADLSAKYPDNRAVDDAFYNAVDWNQVATISKGDVNAWWGYTVGARAKLFHPQEVFHNYIEGVILDQYKADSKDDDPAQWSYKWQGGQTSVDKGKFAFFILPGRHNGKYSKRSFGTQEEATYSRAERSLPKHRRVVAPPPPVSLPKTPGKVDVWTQSGSGANHFGSFNLDCTLAQDAWQTIAPQNTIGLPWDLQIQSGHACAFDSSDFNLDNLHVRYGNQYADVPTEINNKKCSTHNNGVSCEHFTV